jgi:alpha-glucuronidase
LKLLALHCSNLDCRIERGYAGGSLGDCGAAREKIDPRLRDYIRANANLGINGPMLNYVNANLQILSAEYLK